MDIYAKVTNRIIAQLDQGIIPWHKPWIASNQAISHTTGKPYSLLNQLLLGKPGEYLTFVSVARLEMLLTTISRMKLTTELKSPIAVA